MSRDPIGPAGYFGKSRLARFVPSQGLQGDRGPFGNAGEVGPQVDQGKFVIDSHFLMSDCFSCLLNLIRMTASETIHAIADRMARLEQKVQSYFDQVEKLYGNV